MSYTFLLPSSKGKETLHFSDRHNIVVIDSSLDLQLILLINIFLTFFAQLKIVSDF